MMEHYGGWVVLLSLIAILVLPGIYFGWKHRNDGKFKITIEDEKYILWYGYDGEWLRNSEHETEEDAIDKVKFYFEARANRPVMPKWPI